MTSRYCISKVHLAFAIKWYLPDGSLMQQEKVFHMIQSAVFYPWNKGVPYIVISSFFVLTDWYS